MESWLSHQNIPAAQQNGIYQNRTFRRRTDMERLTYFDGGKWRLKIGDMEYSGKAVDRLHELDKADKEDGTE